MSVYPLLARKTLEYRFAHGKAPEKTADVLNDSEIASAEGPALDNPAQGAFVSLHTGIKGALRGCIGTISGTRGTLGEEIMGNAMEAAFRDPRFPPLKHEELAGLHISVDILGPSEAAERGNLDPEVYGVIVSSGWKRGLLLPALDGVKDVDTQLSIACRKAGIAVSEPYSIRRFKVDRYSEQEN